MRKLNVLIAGSTGYIGIQLVKLLIKHPDINIKYLCGNTSKGKSISYFDKRLKNMVKNNTDLYIDENLLEDPYEKKLYNKFLSIKKFFTVEYIKKSPSLTMNAIIETSPDLENFFDNVLVMDKNNHIKKNRLNLLTNIKKLISKFINLSEI